MKAYTLVGVDGNAYSVMGYVKRAMEHAYRDASTPDEDGQIDEVAMAEFGKEAQVAYGEDARSSDYNHLLCVSMDMVDKINDYLEHSPGFDGWDDEYYDDDYDDYEED